MEQLMKPLPYPAIDFHFWVMYGSWSMCPSCKSYFFNDEYWRQAVYQNQQTSAKPDLLAAYRRQVPSDPMRHEYGEIGVSSRWWYLPGMYTPSKQCSCTVSTPQPSDPGERLARNMRARTEEYEAQQQTAVERTGQLYRIPCVDDDFCAAECITWPRYHDGHFRLNQMGESMIDLSLEEATALIIVVLRCSLKKEGYGGPHHFNWKKVGLSRAYFQKELVTEPGLYAKGMPRAAAAFRFLMAKNKYYAYFHRMHEERLKNGQNMNISSYHLFVHKDYVGIECAMCPVLYPMTEFSDTGIIQAYRDDVDDSTNRVLRIGHSWTKKVLSSVRAYGERRDLPFFLYEKYLANKYFASIVRAKQLGVTGDVMARDSQASTGYWEIVQDSLADLVRIQLSRCYDQENYPDLYNSVRNCRGAVWACAFPNVFLTITVAEWKFPRPYFLQAYKDSVN